MSHLDWMPTIMAAAGVPDVKEQLVKGMKVGDTTYKVHLDGYNLLPLLTGETTESPRKEFFYFGDEGGLNLLALRQLEDRLFRTALPGHDGDLGRTVY